MGERLHLCIVALEHMTLCSWYSAFVSFDCFGILTPTSNKFLLNERYGIEMIRIKQHLDICQYTRLIFLHHMTITSRLQNKSVESKWQNNGASSENIAAVSKAREFLTKTRSKKTQTSF